MGVPGEGSRLRAELAQARAEVRRLRQANTTLAQQQASDAATIHTLRQRIQDLEDLVAQALAALPALQQQVTDLQAQLTTTQVDLATAQTALAATTLPPPAGPPPPPPAWAKPNTPSRAVRPRRKRAPAHNRARRRQDPTRVVAHQLDTCPDCGQPLTRQRLYRTRQVVEVPPPPPVEVIEHQVWAGYCSACRHWHHPSLDLHAQVLGQARFGLRASSLLATLRYQARLPLEVIRGLLADLWGWPVSHGGLIGLLHRLREHLEPAFQSLLDQARASPVLHMDETGWRQDGDNGYIWELATGGRHPLRLYVYDPSRAGAVVLRLLDGRFTGVLVCDFYAGYNGYPGVIQRCWVHFLRDLHELRTTHRDNASVQRWVKAVVGLYRVGKEWVRRYPAASEPARVGAYGKLVGRMRALGLEYAQQPEHPCHVLAQRIMRHEGELFQYVRLPGVPADNNLAERGMRGLVVQRKISGGTRSGEGTLTQLRLASLVATWQARGQTPFVELLTLLSTPPAPQAVSG